MRPGFAFLVTVLAVLSAAAVYKNIVRSSGNPNAAVPREIIQLYAQWKQSHGKLYATPAENNHRLQVFHSQKQFIDKANTDYAAAWAEKYGKALEAPVFALNGFADLTNEEFRVKYTSGASESEVTIQDHTARNLKEEQENLSQVPPSTYQYFPRNMGSFASSWAFAFTEMYEKHYFDVTRTRASFSQQELIDCYSSIGLADITLMINKYGLSLASSYPYVAARQTCNTKERIAAAQMLYYTQGTAEMDFTRRLTDRGYHPFSGVYASGKFRYIGNTPDFVDASLAKECSVGYDSRITIYGSGSGSTFQLMNFWGTLWGENGLKYILPCYTTSYWGTGSSTYWLEQF